MALRLLALLPLALALKRRAGPDPGVDGEVDRVDFLEEERGKTQGTTAVGEEVAAYRSENPENWTASQLMEELNTNFTNSAVFQTRLHKWCKHARDQWECETVNKFTHYCPALYTAANETVARTELVGSVLEFIETTAANKIFTKEGLEVASLLQVAVEKPWNLFKRKNKTAEAEREEKEARLHPALRKNGREAADEKSSKRDNPLTLMAEEMEIKKNNQLAAALFSNPFPEVSNSTAYEEKIKEKCEFKSRRKMPECMDEARQNLLCLAVGKVMLKFTDFASLSEKMQGLLQEVPQLNFRL